MNIDLGSFAYGSRLENGVGTPSWGTALGQSSPNYYLTKEGCNNIIMGMAYCSVPLETVSLPLGRGGHIINCHEAGTIQIASVFNKVFVNKVQINKPFIMVLQKEESDSHFGRRSIKYAEKTTYVNDGEEFSNLDFKEEVYQQFKLAEDACWFVYNIDVLNHEELHFDAIFVDINNSVGYTDSQARSRKWLQMISEAVKEDGSNLSNNLDSSSLLPRTFSASSSTPFINTLLTAIKTKPFVLLAGISGTGKSRIVRELARACWPIESEERKAQSPKNFKMIQVRPNWHDSSDILGYVSRISGEEFVIGDFLRAIAEAWQNTSIPYFVCLDEMNLAPVEQYFAEYLSVFESRKFDDDKECFVTDNIISPIFENKEGNKEVKEYYKNLVKDLLNDCPTNKVFALNNQFLEEGISIPPNLIVIGTVNMDETTYSFSRKVLDRAMTIEMNEVNLEAGIGDNSNENDFSNIILSQGDILPKAKSLDVLINENPKISADVVEYLKNINTILDKTPFKIAFRTRNEAIIYVLNMLELRKEEDQDLVMQDALDDITMMKILSRIEGDESKIKKEQLISLQNEVGQKSKEKLSYMIQRLASGFTSFWE